MQKTKGITIHVGLESEQYSLQPKYQSWQVLVNVLFGLLKPRFLVKLDPANSILEVLELFGVFGHFGLSLLVLQSVCNVIIHILILQDLLVKVRQ